MVEFDRHHVLFIRREWNAGGMSKDLRADMIYTMPRDVHNELHRACPPPALLAGRVLREVMDVHYHDPDPVRATQRLMLDISRASEGKDVHRIQKEMAELTIRALELQIPFLGESPDITRRRR